METETQKSSNLEKATNLVSGGPGISHYVSKICTLKSYVLLCYPAEQWLKLNENIDHRSLTLGHSNSSINVYFLQSAYTSKCHGGHKAGRKL